MRIKIKTISQQILSDDLILLIKSLTLSFCVCNFFPVLSIWTSFCFTFIPISFNPSPAFSTSILIACIPFPISFNLSSCPFFLLSHSSICFLSSSYNSLCSEFSLNLLLCKKSSNCSILLSFSFNSSSTSSPLYFFSNISILFLSKSNICFFCSKSKKIFFFFCWALSSFSKSSKEGFKSLIKSFNILSILFFSIISLGLLLSSYFCFCINKASNLDIFSLSWNLTLVNESFTSSNLLSL